MIRTDRPNKKGVLVTRSTSPAQSEEKATEDQVKKVRKVRNKQKQLN